VAASHVADFGQTILGSRPDESLGHLQKELTSFPIVHKAVAMLNKNVVQLNRHRPAVVTRKKCADQNAQSNTLFSHIHLFPELFCTSVDNVFLESPRTRFFI